MPGQKSFRRFILINDIIGDIVSDILNDTYDVIFLHMEDLGTRETCKCVSIHIKPSRLVC